MESTRSDNPLLLLEDRIEKRETGELMRITLTLDPEGRGILCSLDTANKMPRRLTEQCIDTVTAVLNAARERLCAS